MMSDSVAPQELDDLVARFRLHREAYHSGQYNETQLRREFVDPLLKVLGWDVDNTQGYAPAYKDVIHEDSLKVGGQTKAPDYSFRIGGTRKFFVETKKPAVNLKDDPSPAYQLRRYAWSAKLPLSILTDFEEFAVYNCRVRPNKNDKASTERVLYITSDEYADRWDEIASIFSREAILRGSFDKYAESKKKRGTAEVDEAFLGEIEAWREKLARNLALRNPDLEQRELNYAVQKTIDRIIFLRICEDRGIEAQHRLQGLINGPKLYERLCELFRQADVRYNSGLFHFQHEAGRPDEPDEWTLRLSIDDSLLKEIISHLYYPDSPYEFSVLPADILGQVYEQFLGKVIRLTKGHRAVVEDKPEVKKAGGVYYTPTYIVDYIVHNTIGKLVEGKAAYEVAGRTKTWKQSKKGRPLAVLDPACGSGSFLIGAYQFLLDWYRDWFSNNETKNWLTGKEPTIYEALRDDAETPNYRLTTSEKKRILLDHIYGVDIDPQAVEVTKLSLLLKVLEGETHETLQRQLFAKERALPDLGNNIKCGNSLIGPDYYIDRQGDLFDAEQLLRINAFDWQLELSRIMKFGGFDVVIGNPPWGGDIDKELPYFHYVFPQSTRYHTDSFKLFVDKAIQLANTGGRISMIVPQPLLRQRRLKDLRQLMLTLSIEAIVDLGEDVFKGVVAPSCIFVVSNDKPRSDHSFELTSIVRVAPEDKPSAIVATDSVRGKVHQCSVVENSDLELREPAPRSLASILPLGSLSIFKIRDAGINYQRVKVGMQEKGKSDLAARLLYEGVQKRSADQMYWKGSDIGRFWTAKSTRRWCCPDIQLRSNEVLRLNSKVYGTAPKILIRQTADRPMATIDDVGVWFGRSIIAITEESARSDSLYYLTGLLNSRYMTHVYHEITREQGRVFAQVKLSKLKQLPIRTIDFSIPEEQILHDRMVTLVKQMHELGKQIYSARTEHERNVLQRQFEATDHQIDHLVYELYGLTDDEIRLAGAETH